VALLLLIVPGVIYLFVSKGADAAQTAFMMGRKDTENSSNLSNRAPLWAELSESVAEKPVLGSGYAAFWNAARVAKVSADQGWAVPHAHNTYLDQTLSLGFVGSLLYASFLWTACFLSWKRYRRNRTASNLFAAVLLSWLAMEGVAESVPLDPYLPSLLAYTCAVKMCLIEGTEEESDRYLGKDEVVGGLSPASIESLPPERRAEADQILSEAA